MNRAITTFLFLKKRIFIGCIFLMASVIVILAVRNNHIKATQNEFETIMASVDEIVPDLMRTHLLSWALIEDVKVNIESSVAPAESQGFYHWTEHCVVRFYLSDKFDSLKDSEQYELIDAYGDLVYSLKSEIIRDLLPKHGSYSSFMTEENDALKLVYGETVFINEKYDIFFETSRNTYEYARHVADFFVKNGKDYWVQTDSADFEGYSIAAPYVGMSEAAISSTALGKPTVSQKCIDFYKLKPSHRSTEYRWYENGIQDLQHLQAVATVWYWDFKRKTEVDGYVSSVTIYD